MRTSNVQRVLDLATGLSSAERAELVTELLSQLNYPGEEVTGQDWERLWGTEIDRRLDDFERGEPGMSLDEVRAHVAVALAQSRRSG
jgi:hypothetical protein